MPISFPMTNPLLGRSERIPFHAIGAEHVRPAVREILARADGEINQVAEALGEPSYDRTIQRIDDIVQGVEEGVAPARLLLSVAETPELREAYNAVLPEIAAFWSRLPLHPGLWAAVEGFSRSPEAGDLDPLRRRNLDKMLREFRKAGAELGDADKARLQEIRVELSELQQRFSENVLDATNAFELHVTDRARLDGIPETALELARLKASERDLDGWLLTLDYPSYEPVLKYALDRELRKQLHLAYVQRCREGKLNNQPVIDRVLEFRREMSVLLGYADYSDYRLDEAMAKSGAGAFDFVEDLRDRTVRYWDRDLEQLNAHAARLEIDEIEPWDLGYVSESLRRERFEIDDEMVRPYFPLSRVLAGLFDIVERVFGITVSERQVEEVWHPDVRCYDLEDRDGTHLGSFYTDWFPRKGKRQGAWMSTLTTGGPHADGTFLPHVGCIAGNFAPPAPGKPALLTHRNVETIFHEFGHLLHHCTSRVPLPSRSGMHVPWDWVEVPSQIMENWTWEREALPSFSGHYETQEPFPVHLYERMLAARRFMGGYAQMRQLGFATLDLRLHREYRGGEEADVMAYVERVMMPFVPSATFSKSHILTTFSHLFAGGYASAYYSYLWSEVLEADAFSRFKQEGVFSKEAGRAFMESILSKGDSEEPNEMFRSFMGRDPDPDALLRRNLGELEERVAAD